ncbi:TatD family hydrolase [Cytophagaceae bacterium ABcell3]|nr:TatD family hydrolase [Cytophagaceae bacterium ABcell3]
MFVDSHAHIYSSQFAEDRDKVLEDCREAKVNKIYMPNIDDQSIDHMLEAELRYNSTCIPCMGLHPCSVDKGFEKKLYIIEDWLSKRSFAAVGEIGTDLFHDTTWFEQQKEAFNVQVKWALQYDLPIVIHCRNSLKETIAELKKQEEMPKGIFHCFTGTVEDAREIIEMGFYLGIGGVLTFKNGGLDKVVPEIPLDRIVLETDSPYLAPTPHRGKRNDPSYIPLIAKKLADLKNINIEEVAAQTTQNAENIFVEVEN